MSQYYNLSLTNTTDSEINLAVSDDTYVPILMKSSDYKVSVLKFSFPSQNPTFIIDNTDDYKMKFSINKFINGYGELSQENSLYKNTDFNIGNINDFLENFNRTAILTHRDLLNQLCDTYTGIDVLGGTFPINSKKTVNVNQTFTAATTTDFTLDFSTDIASDLMVCSIEVDISLSTFSGNGMLIELDLIDNLGNSMTIMSKKQIQNNPRIYFSDTSINSQSTTKVLSKTNYQPLEPFSKLIIQADNSQKGNWKLRFHSRNGQLLNDITFDANIKVMFSPVYGFPLVTQDVNYPKIAPALHYNQQTKTITLLYDEQIHRSAFTIEVSKKLYNILP